jgi:hypothetical protein
MSQQTQEATGLPAGVDGVVHLGECGCQTSEVRLHPDLAAEVRGIVAKEVERRLREGERELPLHERMRRAFERGETALSVSREEFEELTGGRPTLGVAKDDYIFAANEEPKPEDWRASLVATTRSRIQRHQESAARLATLIGYVESLPLGSGFETMSRAVQSSLWRDDF